MGNTARRAAAWLAGLGLCAGAFTPAFAEGDWGGGPPCQEVVGQAEIDGTLQQIVGLACLQPDGTWQIVDSAGAGPQYYATPYYYDTPWYWAPVGVGIGASVIFVDHFHHAHPMHRVFFHRGGMGGFHGFAGGRGFRAVAPGGMRGGGGMHGGFHGGGGHH